jgi:hypothetical protein
MKSKKGITFQSATNHKSVMNSSLANAIKVSNDYLAARKAFAAIADSNDWLRGNDNYIGRIGEMVAMRYLQKYYGLQFKDIQERNKSRKSVDLKAGGTWWSVKCVTDESQTGRTSPYHTLEREGQPGMWFWPPLIIVRIEYVRTEEVRISGIAYPKGLEAATGEIGEPGSGRTKTLATKERFKKVVEQPGLVELLDWNTLVG